MRVLLSGLKYKDLQRIGTQRPIDLVIFDKRFDQDEIDRFLRNRITNKSDDCATITLESGAEPMPVASQVSNEKTCSHSVLGGTFDRLHVAHKLLLSEAALRSERKITVGITEENMLYGKISMQLETGF